MRIHRSLEAPIRCLLLIVLTFGVLGETRGTREAKKHLEQMQEKRLAKQITQRTVRRLAALEVHAQANRSQPCAL